MRINESIEVEASPHEGWGFISDFTNYLDFMAGLTRWELAGNRSSGLGARFRVLIRVGAADVGVLSDIWEWDEPREIAFTSVTGLDQRGRWRLRDAPEGTTRVEFRWAYGVAGGGIAGVISERLAAPGLRRNLRRSLTQLKRGVEHGRFERT